jgi:hypothetical protein
MLFWTDASFRQKTEQKENSTFCKENSNIGIVCGAFNIIFSLHAQSKTTVIL